MGSSVNLTIILAIVVVVILSPHDVSATDHIVGANKGWNPGLNYTSWVKNHTFFVGDFISFRYQKNQYNVFEVNETGYGNCTTEGSLGNWTSGKDFILLTMAKRYFFIGGNGQCQNGMKVSVVVHPLPPPPSSSPSDHRNSSDAAVPRPPFRAIAVSIALGLAGSFLGF